MEIQWGQLKPYAMQSHSEAGWDAPNSSSACLSKGNVGGADGNMHWIFYLYPFYTTVSGYKLRPIVYTYGYNNGTRKYVFVLYHISIQLTNQVENKSTEHVV